MKLKFLAKPTPQAARALDTPAIVPDDVPEPIAAPAPDARPVTQLDLSTRTLNALLAAGVETIEQLKAHDDLTAIPRFGAKSVEEVELALAKFQTPPDELPLTFKGLIVIIGDADVFAPKGWKLVDMEATFGPTTDGFDLIARLKHMRQYSHLMVHLRKPADMQSVSEFCDRNKVPVVTCG